MTPSRRETTTRSEKLDLPLTPEAKRALPRSYRCENTSNSSSAAVGDSGTYVLTPDRVLWKNSGRLF